MFRGFRAIAYKETKQMRRDRTTLIFILLIPVMQLIIFGYAINTTVSNVKTAIFDLDNSQASRQFVRELENTNYFKVTSTASSNAQLYQLIVNGDVKVGIFIPREYEKKILNSRGGEIQALIDGSDSTVALQTQSAVEALGRQKSIDIVTKRLAADKTPLPITVKTKMLFNPDSKTATFMVPALVAVILQLSTVFLTAISIVKEKENGTLEQILVTPVQPFGLMLGKILPYSVVGFFQAASVLALMRIVFGVHIQGSLLLLLSLTLLYIFAALGLGLLISTKAKNQMQAVQMSFLIMLPSILLSGYMFPRESMPFVMQLIGYAIPATYFVDIMRGVVLRGADITGLWQDALCLAAMGVLFISLSAARFKKSIG